MEPPHRPLAVELALQLGLIAPEQASPDLRTVSDLADRGLIDERQKQTLLARIERMSAAETEPVAPDDLRTRIAADQALDLLAKPHEGPKRLGRYDLLGELGRGGMGVVYRARDEQLGRVVAVKLLRSLDSPDLRSRFLREARAAALLRHPSIVPVHDVGEEGGQPYFVMDLIEGQGLDRALASKSIDLRAAVDVLRQAAEAVHFAHSKGIVHRDLKPGNILVSPQKKALVVDFGLARMQEMEDRKLSLSGVALGTPAYMSPEQAQGKWSEVDARSDVYSLGATLYEVLAGRPPFTGMSANEVLIAAISEEAMAPSSVCSDVDRELETICLKAIHKDRARRYASAGEFAADLGRWLAGEAILARAPSVWSRLTRRARKRGVWAAAGLAILAVGALFLWPGTARIESDPPGAQIWIDGKPRGTAPAHVRLWPPGSHLVELRLEGFEAARTTVSSRLWSQAAIRLPLSRAFGEVRFEVRPADATYDLSSEELQRSGPVSDTLKLPVGRYRVRLSKGGHLSRIEDLSVRPGEASIVRSDLPPVLMWEWACDPFDAAVTEDLDEDGKPEVVVARQLGYDILNGADGKLMGSQFLYADHSRKDQVKFYSARGVDGILLGVHESPSSSLWLYPFRKEKEKLRGDPDIYSLPDLEPGDLDGDGFPDWCWRYGRTLRMMSGKTLKQAWSVPAPGGLRGILCGTGDRNVIVIHDTTILLLSGADGSAIWSRSGVMFGARAPGFLAFRILGKLEMGAVIDGRPAWERPGSPIVCSVPPPDVNGDGRPDVPVLLESGGALLSGATGDPIWDRGAVAAGDRLIASGDLDADGVPDLLVVGPRAAAISGSTGRAIWTANVEGTYAACADVTGDQVVDVMWNSGNAVRILSSRDGGIVWDQELKGPVRYRGSADFDGDGSPEIVLLTPQGVVVFRTRER